MSSINPIIHQIWLSDNPIPEQLKRYKDTVLEKHPSFGRYHYRSWEYRLWTDDAITEFYDHPSLDVKALLAKCDSVVTKADVIRLLAVQKYGGVYLDMDIECLKAITPLLNVPAFIARENETDCCSAVFGASKGHSWINSMVEDLPEMVVRKGSWIIGLMTAATNVPSNGVTIYPREFFYPFMYDQDKDLNMIGENTYLIHHWQKSWWKKYIQHLAGHAFGKISRERVDQRCRICGEILKEKLSRDYFEEGSPVFVLDLEPKMVVAHLPSGQEALRCKQGPIL